MSSPGIPRILLSKGYGCWYNYSLLYIILIDAEMPDRDGISTIEVMGSSSLQSAVVMCSISGDVHTRVRAKEQQVFLERCGAREVL